MVRHNWVAKIVDFYDDQGETLKAKYASFAALPTHVQAADVKEASELPNEQFALVFVDDGRILRKFACNDAGTTEMSVVYFLEHGRNLPAGLRKTAADGLLAACVRNGLSPPEKVIKEASASAVEAALFGQSKTAEIVEVGGVAVEVKQASTTRFAVELEDGQRRYPIDTVNQVKQAEDYWLEQRRRMDPEIRWQYAVKLAARAKEIGYPIDGQIKEAGSTTFAEAGKLKAALEMRKVAFPLGKEEKVFLNELFEKRGSMTPDVYAKCLHRFDVDHDLDGGWDQLFLDPWSSTFGLRKTADVVWQEGADRVTTEELQNLAEQHRGALAELFTDAFISGFEKRPVEIFESLPLPQRRHLARLAADMAANGKTESSTKTVA